MLGSFFFHRVAALGAKTELELIYEIDKSNLIGHWDGSDSDSRTIATGVSVLADKSGAPNALDMSSSVGANQPTVGTGGPNGLDYLDFDGVSQYLSTAGEGDQAWTAHPFTLAIAYIPSRSNDTSGDAFGVAQNVGVNRAASFLDVTAVAGRVRIFAGGSQIFDGVTGTAWQVVIARFDGASSRLVIHDVSSQDGNVGTGWLNFGPPNMAEVVLGARITTGATYTAYGDIRFGEGFAWKASLSDDEMDQVAAYLAEKWKP